MSMDNKNIGSCRCAACDKELKDNEYVLCEDCDIRSSFERDVEELIEEVSKDYIQNQLYEVLNLGDKSWQTHLRESLQ